MSTSRPQPDENGPHAGEDIARVEGEDAVAALTSQERETKRFLDNLTDAHIAGLRYAPGKWTFKEVVGHLIDDERIFVYRAMCIARGDKRTQESFDENAYVAGANFEQRTLKSLRDEYCLVRCATISFFASLPPDAWQRRGTVTDYSATVRGLAFHIAGHELRHLFALKEKYLT